MRVGQGEVFFIIHCRTTFEGRGDAKVATAECHVGVVVRRCRVGREVHVGTVGKGAFLESQYSISQVQGQVDLKSGAKDASDFKSVRSYSSRFSAR